MGYAQDQIETAGQSGYSREELLALYREKSGATEEIAFSREEVEDLTREELDRRRGIVRELVVCARAAGHPQNNVFSAISQTQHTSYMRFAAQSISFFLDAAERTDKKTKELCGILNASAPMTQGEISGLFNFCRMIGEAKNLPQEWIVEKDLPQFSEELLELCARSEENAGLDQKLFTSWKREFLNVSAEELLSRWDYAMRKSSLLRSRRISAICREAGAYCKISAEPDEIHTSLELLARYQENLGRIREIFEKRKSLLPENGESLPREELLSLKAQALLLRGFCEKVRESGCERYRARLTAENRSVLQSFYGTWRTFCEVQSGLYKNFRIDPEKLPVAGDYMTSQIYVCRLWLEHIGALPEWIDYNAEKAVACENGLEKVVAAYEGGMLHEQVEDAFEKGVFHAMCLLFDSEK
ncbi:MAG: hypothetical protein II713_03000 [Clostridia bacterium]|nr:hypothetical protein [Clostridia bacterium]